jgi:hypothetical protein
MDLRRTLRAAIRRLAAARLISLAGTDASAVALGYAPCADGA